MSELIDNTHRKKELLKHLMLQVQEGKAPEAVKNQLAHIMGEVPYETVVEVEQELLGEGLSTDQILKFCDIHTKVLKGQITGKEEKDLPIGHPARTFQEENRSLRWELEGLERLSKELEALPEDEPAGEVLDQIKIRFHALADIEKHYDRKENLLFPYLEKHRITGPSKVMWAKDDQAREMVSAGIEALRELNGATAGEVRAVVELVLEPAKEGIEDMIYREEEILIPLSLDTLSEAEWFSIYQGRRQGPERRPGPTALRKHDSCGDRGHPQHNTLRLDLCGQGRSGPLLHPGQGKDIFPLESHSGTQGSTVPSSFQRPYRRADRGGFSFREAEPGAILDQPERQVHPHRVLRPARPERRVPGNPGS